MKHPWADVDEVLLDAGLGNDPLHLHPQQARVRGDTSFTRALNYLKLLNSKQKKRSTILIKDNFYKLGLG